MKVPFAFDVIRNSTLEMLGVGGLLSVVPINEPTGGKSFLMKSAIDARNLADGAAGFR